MTNNRSAAAGEAMPTQEITLRLRWRQTWADREAHYTAFAESITGSVGCIYLIEDGEDQGLWAWSMTADDYEISHNCGALHGNDRSARHAARRVEDAWFAAIKGTRHDIPSEPVNAYAAARYRYESAA